ncbi:hypothetical protein C8Q76DRAFT_793502 [Earliella scabrosa]|nr:hypothetical protein C8Q76DRAFT_793502 [Earliella scabrosa]
MSDIDESLLRLWQALLDHWRNVGPDAFLPGRVLDITPWGSLWGPWALFEITHGRLYVREEYDEMYRRLVGAFRSIAPVHLGVAITGQPGIGKSCFGIYVLLRRLSEDKEGDIIYAPVEQVYSIRFHAGVVSAITDAECGDRQWHSDPTLRRWLLIEPGSHPKIREGLLHESLYRVVFLSPKESRMGPLIREYGFNMWIMSLWTETELVALYDNGLLAQEMYQLEEVQPPDAMVKHAIERAGPCPRDINLWAARPDMFFLHVEETVQRVNELAPLLYPTLFDWSDAMSHVLIVVDRRPGDKPIRDDLGDDKYDVRIKNEIIRKWLWRRSLELTMESALQFFNMTRGQTRVIAGVAFEGIVLRCISGHAPASARVDMMRAFARMERVSTKSKKFPHVFEYSPDGGVISHILVMSDDGLQLVEVAATTLPSTTHLVATPAAITVPQGTSHTTPLDFLLRSREYVRFTDMNQISATNDEFYLPLAHNFPLFDALCFNVLDDTIDLWAIQVTIKKTHTGVSSGFAFIEELMSRTRARHPEKTVVVKYLMLAPDNQRWTVQWQLAPDFVPGEVFIQYMDVTRQCEHCTPENVIEDDVM